MAKNVIAVKKITFELCVKSPFLLLESNEYTQNDSKER